MHTLTLRKLVVTHNGNFQVDEVFAVAVLDLLYRGEIEVVRTRDQSLIEKADYVVDVGVEYDPVRGRFDHHQKGGAGERPNGIPYSSFGLVWRKYGEELCGSKEVADYIDRNMVQGICAADERIDTFAPTIPDVSPYLLHDAFMSFYPAEHEEKYTFDDAFKEVLAIAKKILSREIHHAQAFIRETPEVLQAYQDASDKRLIILSGYSEVWEEILCRFPEPLIVVKPRPQDAFWEAKSVRNNPHIFNTRTLFPEDWAGKHGEDLASVSGVSDALFCHDKRYIAVAKSREGASLLARKALDS